MGHPDQHTPDRHNVTNREDAPEPRVPEAAKDDLNDPALEARADTGETVRTPEPEGQRQGEAGAEYVGREMDDRQKANPRIDEAARAKKEPAQNPDAGKDPEKQDQEDL
ncbi:MAG: hypothetical protein R3362_12150 [Rhodothermales bacterium]|nr:hypothetical protein [Rhodothermales bacterium]